MTHFEDRLAAEEAKGLRRRLPHPRGPRSLEDVLDFGSNDYLGLSNHPRLIEAAQIATRIWGTGAGASRLLRGNTQLHEELEHDLARLKRTDAALVFSSGYAANVGLLTALAEEGDAIYCDRLDHASIVDGARLAKAKLHFYEHGDVDHLERQLKRRAGAAVSGRAWIVTDGVFSMDGVLAPLPDLQRLALEHDATLIVDDAHATGVLGEHGAGTLSHFGLETTNVIQMGTLSKALGSQGGFVAAPKETIDWLVQSSRSFIYSTALAPAAVAAASEALRVVRDEPQRNARLQRHLNVLRTGLAAAGCEVLGEAPCPMIAVKIGDADAAVEVARKLDDDGIVAPAIRPPTVPKGTSRIRLAPRADMDDADVRQVVEAFSKL